MEKYLKKERLENYSTLRNLLPTMNTANEFHIKIMFFLLKKSYWLLKKNRTSLVSVAYSLIKKADVNK